MIFSHLLDMRDYVGFIVNMCMVAQEKKNYECFRYAGAFQCGELLLNK